MGNHLKWSLSMQFHGSKVLDESEGERNDGNSVMVLCGFSHKEESVTTTGLSLLSVESVSINRDGLLSTGKPSRSNLGKWGSPILLFGSGLVTLLSLLAAILAAIVASTAITVLFIFIFATVAYGPLSYVLFVCNLEKLTANQNTLWLL